MKLQELFKQSQLRNFPKDQIILHQNDPLDTYFYIKKGFIKIYNITDEGDERILMMMGKGDSFPFVIPTKKRSHKLKYFYEATSKVELLSVPRSKFNSLIKSDNNLAQCVLEYIAKISDRLLDRLDIVESKTAEHKVARMLPFLAKRFSKVPKKGYSKLRLKLTHQDIANMTGLTRETTSIQMKKLENEGAISQADDKLKVDVKKIKDISE